MGLSATGGTPSVDEAGKRPKTVAALESSTPAGKTSSTGDAKVSKEDMEDMEDMPFGEM